MLQVRIRQELVIFDYFIIINKQMAICKMIIMIIKVNYNYNKNLPEPFRHLLKKA